MPAGTVPWQPDSPREGTVSLSQTVSLTRIVNNMPVAWRGRPLAKAVEQTNTCSYLSSRAKYDDGNFLKTSVQVVNLRPDVGVFLNEKKRGN